MGLLGGAMTVRRFRVEGTVPEAFREAFRDQIGAFAFQESPVDRGLEEAEGWVQVHNLLETEFDNFDTWLYEHYAVFSLRVDKKVLPAKLFNATVQKKCAEWAEEHDRERCPSSERTRIKEDLEDAWLKRTLPRVAVTDAVWNITEGWFLIASHSDSIMERFRKRFHQSFGMTLVPCSPIDWVTDPEVAQALIDLPPSLELVEAR